MKDDSLPALSRRQQQILDLVCEGLSYAEISRKLSISYDTVRTHGKRLFEALGVHTRVELVTFAFAHSLVKPADERATWVRLRAVDDAELDSLCQVAYVALFGPHAKPWREQSNSARARMRAAMRAASELRQSQLRGV